MACSSCGRPEGHFLENPGESESPAKRRGRRVDVHAGIIAADKRRPRETAKVHRRPVAAKSEYSDFRIYGGSNGDFTLYEDEGDNYDYEHGAYSTISMDWDDKTQTLTIGNRRGSFPGMLERRTFRLVRVTETHGVGVTPVSEFDATVQYAGKTISVRLPLPRK